MKDKIISLLLTQSDFEHPLLARELHSMVDTKLSLDSFRRLLPNMFNEFNEAQYAKVIHGMISKQNAVLILSTKSGGYFSAKDSKSRKSGGYAYFSTISTELQKARFINKFIKEVDNNSFQVEFAFLKEENSNELF